MRDEPQREEKRRRKEQNEKKFESNSIALQSEYAHSYGIMTGICCLSSCSYVVSSSPFLLSLPFSFPFLFFPFPSLSFPRVRRRRRMRHLEEDGTGRDRDDNGTEGWEEINRQQNQPIVNPWPYLYKRICICECVMLLCGWLFVICVSVVD